MMSVITFKSSFSFATTAQFSQLARSVYGGAKRNAVSASETILSGEAPSGDNMQAVDCVR